MLLILTRKALLLTFSLSFATLGSGMYDNGRAFSLASSDKASLSTRSVFIIDSAISLVFFGCETTTL